MSMESAKAFIERMKVDEDFRNKVNECKDTETRMALVKKAGFDFSPEELKAYTTELADDDMNKFSGGSGSCTKYCAEFPPIYYYG